MKKQVDKNEEIIKLAESGGNDSSLILYEKILEVEDKIYEIEDKIEKEPPEDIKIEKIAMRLATKLSIMEKGDKGDEPTDERLLELIEPKVSEAINKHGSFITEQDKKDIAKLVDIPTAEKTIEKTTIIREKPIQIVTNEIKEVAKPVNIPKVTELVVKNIEEKGLPISSIVDLQDTLNTLQNRTQLLNQIATQGQRSSGSAIVVRDEGTPLTSALTSIDFVGAGVTATNVGGAVTVTISTSAGAGYQAPTSGVVDGSNKVYTWAVAPNAIVVDGINIRKTASDTTVNWTGTTTTTLSIAPTFDIYAIA